MVRIEQASRNFISTGQQCERKDMVTNVISEIGTTVSQEHIASIIIVEE
jgi:hypothetical protein